VIIPRASQDPALGIPEDFTLPASSVSRAAPGALGNSEPASHEWRMLVPLIRAQTAAPLLQIAEAISAATKSTGLVLGLVEIPGNTMLHRLRAVDERRRDLLRWIAGTDPADGERRLAVELRVSYDVPRGIREAVYENDSNLIVVEWPGLTSRRPRLLGAVINDLVTNPPADLILVRPDPSPGAPVGDRQRILVPVRGGPNSAISVQIASALTRACGGALTVLNVLETSHHPRRRAAQSERFWRLVAGLRHEDFEVDFVQREAARPAEAILAAARDHSTVVMGAFAEGPRSPTLVRAELARVVRLLKHTVILTRARGTGRRAHV
jgi:nucleotide-binding universal stress UspA family protein